MIIRTITAIILNIFLINSLTGQNTLVSMNQDYTNQIFYSLQNGETANVSNEDWDIAFSTDPYSSSIRINDGQGVQLYTYHLGDTSDWAIINNGVTNMLNEPMYNSDTGWSIGAFDINTTTGMDYGWGVYSMISHTVVGDSLFIVQTINGDWKKLWIEEKASGEYFFRYADLDGSNEIIQSIQASNYSSKNFIYFSLEQNIILDREPSSNSWDITFTKYITPVQGMAYPVTGVLSNNGIEVAEATNISAPVTYTDYSLHTFNNEINTIGYDWKSYQGNYVVDANRCYFLRDFSENIWRIIFTSFDGMNTGNIEFNTQLVSNSTNIKNLNEIPTFEIYPNPTNENTTLIYDVSSGQNTLDIYDVLGKKIYSANLDSNQLKTLTLPTSNLDQGIYFVVVTNNNLIAKKKLIVQ